MLATKEVILFNGHAGVSGRLLTADFRSNATAFMGVNGIDNDPHGHPYARADKLGTSCSSAVSCGGEGNLCVKKSTSSTAKVCASVCIDDAGCGSAYRCASVATTGTLSGRACVAR